MRLELSTKQTEAWQALDHPDVLEVFAGGGAGGGKSYLGCAHQIARRATYAGTRGFIGRESFTGLRDSTLKTCRRSSQARDAAAASSRMSKLPGARLNAWRYRAWAPR